MADKNTTVSFFYGAKDGIQAKLDDGTITPSDFVVTKEDELVFIDKAKAQHTLGSSKTKAPIKVTGTSLGGIADGSTIEAGTSLDDFLKKLLVKRIPAKYSAPTLSLGTSVATTPQEVGNVINPKLTATFTQNDAGALANIEIQKGSEKVTGTASPFESTQEVTFSDTPVTFKAVASYGQGAIKEDNLGEQSPAGRIEAGSISSSPLTFQGKRMTFAGTGVGEIPELNSAAIRALASKRLGLGKNSKFDVLVDVGQQHIIIAYPATIGDITQIRYEEANDNSMAANFKKQVIQVAGHNNFTPVNYNVYTYKMDVPAAAKMTFNITL